MHSAVASPRPVWRERFAALRNLPPVLRLVWDAAPAVVAGGLVLRVASALIPLATLWVSKWIIDLVVAAIRNHGPIPVQIWWLLAAEFGLAGLNQILSRTIDYTDARLADEFTREVSLRVMEHAAQLDLASFEDPAFHDKLERARLQATDRIGMLNAMGRLLLQSHNARHAFRRRHCLLSLAVSVARCLCYSRIRRRKPFCFSGIFASARCYSHPPRAGLSAYPRQQ